MKFTEYVIHRISANTVRSILLFGDGGVGKTTALLELYRLLLAYTYEIEGKKVVPVYIPLNEFSSSGIRGDYIRSYIWKTYFDGQVTQNSVSHLDNYLLNEADGRYHFVLLCDGFNETADSGMLVSELNRLATYRNVTVCVTSRYSIAGLVGFDRVQMLPLTIEQIKSVVDRHADVKQMDADTLELLRTPFYLKLWIALPTDQKQAKVNKSDLLENYIAWLLDKQLRHNTAKEFAVGREQDMKIDYTSSVQDVLTYFESLAWESENRHRMVVKAGDPSWKVAMELYPDEILDRLQPVRFGTKVFHECLVSMGLVKEIESNCWKFSHQIYRDYFAARYLADGDFGRLEHKLSRHAVSEDVLEFYAGFFASKEALLDCVREANQVISCDEALKKNPLVNRNVIRLFREATVLLQGEDFSGRDLSTADLNEFSGLLGCDFTNSRFGTDTLWVRDDEWVSAGYGGKFYLLDDYLIDVSFLIMSVFDANSGKRLKIIENEVSFRETPTECFRYNNHHYIARKNWVPKLACNVCCTIVDIEDESCTEIVLDRYGSVKEMAYCAEDESLYILGCLEGEVSDETGQPEDSNQVGCLTIYRMGDRSVKKIQNVVSLGKNQQQETVFYYGPEIGLCIVGASATRVINLPHDAFNRVIDCYCVNGEWVVVTDNTLYMYNVDNLESCCSCLPVLDADRIKKTCLATSYNKLFLLVENALDERLVSYDLETREFQCELEQLCSFADWEEEETSLFVVKENICVFQKTGFTTAEIKRQGLENVSFIPLGEYVSNVAQIQDAFLAKVKSTTGETVILKIDTRGNRIYDKRAHICPRFGHFSEYKGYYYLTLQDHNGILNVVVFDCDLKLKELRRVLGRSQTLRQLRSFLWEGAKLFGNQCEYIVAGSYEVGIFVFKYDATKKAYVEYCRLSSACDMDGGLLRFLNCVDAWIPNFCTADVLGVFDDGLLIKGVTVDVNGELEDVKHFIVDLENKQVKEIAVPLQGTVYFNNAPYVLYAEGEAFFLYNIKTNVLQKQVVDSMKRGALRHLFELKSNTNLYFNHRLWWLSEADGRYRLNVLTPERLILSSDICSICRKVDLHANYDRNEILVTEQKSVYNGSDEPIRVIVFNGDVGHSLEGKTYVIQNRDALMAIDDTYAYFAEDQQERLGEFFRVGPRWYRSMPFDDEARQYLVPFDKDLTESRFIGVNLSDEALQVLRQYGALIDDPS